MNARWKRIVVVAAVAIAVVLAGAVVGSVIRHAQVPVADRVPGSDGSGGVEQALLGQPTPDAAKDAATSAPGELRETMSSVEEAPSPAAAGIEGAERVTIRNASISVTVDDLDKALSAVRAAARAADGYVQDLALSGSDDVRPADSAEGEDGPRNATVTLRVPARAVPAVLQAGGKLGDVTSQTESEQDVTFEAIDLEARIANLKAEEERLRSFLDEAKRVSEMLEVEVELARVRGEIEAMSAQLAQIERQAAMATVTVNLFEPGPVVRPSGVDWGLRDAVTQGVQAAASITAASVSGLIAVSPLVLAGLLLYAVWRFTRRQRSGRHPAELSQPGV